MFTTFRFEPVPLADVFHLVYSVPPLHFDMQLKPMPSIFASKPGRALTFTLAAIGLAFLILHYLHLDSFEASIPSNVLQDQSSPSSRPKGRLHLLIAATGSNADLCKLLLSAKILNYPTPVLINYGDHEDKDNAYAQHLGKVEGIYNYLEQLEPLDGYTEDLVLVIDGFDLWFQLRPDVLIKRFYAVNAEAEARAISLYGSEIVDRFDVRQKVIFGPDKLCWPVDYSRPACWAVPESPLHPTSYGPAVEYEDREKNEAKWLNSGTVMGRAQDVKEVFRATLQAIQDNHTTDSDQFYFANLFGQQEYARISRVPGLLQRLKNKTYIDSEDTAGDEPRRLEPTPDHDFMRTEYHIGIDYSSAMFQTFAFWKQHLVWMRATDSWYRPNNSRHLENPRMMSVPDDIEQSALPFGNLEDTPDHSHQPDWSEVDLFYNTITKQIPVALHFTGNPDEKRFRAWWWQKLWFQSQAESLKNASLMVGSQSISESPIAGLKWFNAEAGDADDLVGGGKAGAWSDRRGWLSWKRLCKSVETEIYHVPGNDFFHPRSVDK